MPSVLPGYIWDKKTGRYRNASTGRFVARQKVLDLLDYALDEQEKRQAQGAASFMDEQLDGNVWLVRSKDILKQSYLQSAALEAGGWDQLTPRDFGRVGGRLRIEYARLASLKDQIDNGQVTYAQVMNRLHMYHGGARALGLSIGREHLPTPPPGKVRIERRTLGQAEHCDDCVRFVALGWQPEGVLPVPGDESVCDGNCRCGMTTRLVPEERASQYYGTKKR